MKETPMQVLERLNAEAGRVRCLLCSTQNRDVFHKLSDCPKAKASQEKVVAMSEPELDAYLDNAGIDIKPALEKLHNKLTELKAEKPEMPELSTEFLHSKIQEVRNGRS